MSEHSLQTLLVIIPLLPMAGFIINRFFGRRLGERAVSLIGPGVVGLAFLLSVIVIVSLSLSGEERLVAYVLPWMHVGQFQVDFAYVLDHLSAVMLLVVTGVGFLIHVYSIGYMHGDKSYHVYFSYLNLFVFMMLTLVMAENVLLMFLGWEGVGLCSYLLIGFWFEEWERARAGMKAFVVNRVGDFGFLLGILLLFWTSWELGHPTLSFHSLEEIVTRMSPPVITIICLLLFVGATGKSAQIPLYVWLPDAMAGPTPVSALIHAATMVTAGVYMVARLNFMYSLSPTASLVVAAVGALTAFYAGTMGVVATGIKKVLAYSTISQLGYMFLGVGVGAYVDGMFHLTTHAFFKALLFLGAGSVMHAMADEEDIMKMGGLRKYIPYTYWVFLFGALALAGVPPFAGFFSKDEILLKTFAQGHYVLYAIGLAGAFVTAFYTFRLVFLTFHGEERFDHHKVHPHESPWVMIVPMMILAVLSLIGGAVLGFPHHSLMEGYLEELFRYEVHAEGAPAGLLMLVSTVVALSGIGLAGYVYLLRPELPSRIAERFKGLYSLLWNKYWVDEIYQALFVNGALGLARSLARFDLGVVDFLVNFSARFTVLVSRFSGWFDLKGVDGAVNAIASATEGAGDGVRRVQTGVLQNYLLIFILGVACIVAYKIFFGG